MKIRALSLDLRVLVGALVAFAVGVFLVTVLFGLFNPRDTSQQEAAVVAGALRVAHGEPLFLDIQRSPQVAAQASGDVLIEDENVALKCGKPLTIMDPLAFACMEKRSRWDDGPLNRRILARDFGALRSVLEHPSRYQGKIYWSPTTLQAMERAYRMEERVDGYFVYRTRAELGPAMTGGNS